VNVQICKTDNSFGEMPIDWVANLRGEPYAALGLAVFLFFQSLFSKLLFITSYLLELFSFTATVKLFGMFSVNCRKE